MDNRHNNPQSPSCNGCYHSYFHVSTSGELVNIRYSPDTPWACLSCNRYWPDGFTPDHDDSLWPHKFATLREAQDKQEEIMQQFREERGGVD